VAVDLTAHAVFLMVQARLLLARDMAAVEARIAALFMADRAVFAMEGCGLMRADAAFAQRAMDAHVLMPEAMVHFDTARMGILPGRRRGARGARQRQACAHDRNENFLLETHNATPLF